MHFQRFEQCFTRVLRRQRIVWVKFGNDDSGQRHTAKETQVSEDPLS